MVDETSDVLGSLGDVRSASEVDEEVILEDEVSSSELATVSMMEGHGGGFILGRPPVDSPSP